jgi:hypothetical protein
MLLGSEVELLMVIEMFLRGIMGTGRLYSYTAGETG